MRLEVAGNTMVIADIILIKSPANFYALKVVDDADLEEDLEHDLLSQIGVS